METEKPKVADSLASLNQEPEPEATQPNSSEALENLETRIRPEWMKTAMAKPEQAGFPTPLPTPPTDTPEPTLSNTEGLPTPNAPGHSAKKAFPTKLLLIGVAGVLVLIVLMVLLLGKKDPGKVGGKNGVELTYWGLWEPNPIMDGLIADFQSKNPGVTVKYRMHQKDDYRMRLDNKLAAQDSETPDIFRIHVNWLPMFSGKLAPVPAQTANALELDSQYFSIYKTALSGPAGYMAVPLMYDGLALFYNQDILTAAQKKVPKTWWGLRQLAKELTVKDNSGKIRTAGVALGTTNNVDHWSDILGLMLMQNEVDFSKLKGQLAEDVLAFYTLFSLEDGVWDETLPASTYYFGSGQLAFYFGPSWRIFNLKEINPNLKFGVAPVPQLPKITAIDLTEAENENTELTNVNWGTFWVEGVAKTSKHQKEAWKFVEYLASKEGLQKLYSTASQMRDFGELYPRTDLAGELTSNPLLGPFVQGATSAKTWYLTSRTFDAGVCDQTIKYFEDAINGVVLDRKTPSEVSETLQSGIQQVMDKYQIK